MKKILFFFLCASCTSFLSAQITLTAEKNTPRIGDKVTSYTYNGTVNSGNAGVNQTWDFGAYAGGDESTVLYFAASEGADAAKYPLANIVQKQQDIEDEADVYLSTTTGIALVGANLIGVLTGIKAETSYTDPQEVIKFPLSYETKYSETFAATIKTLVTIEGMGEMDMEVDRSGTVEIEADGYGTLILPHGTYTNVLRVKVTTVYIDKYMGMPIDNSTDVSYCWYSNYSHAPLATCSHIVGSELDMSIFSYISKESIHTSVNDIRAAGVLGIYPNPVKAGEKVTLLTDGLNNEIEWQLLTLDGKVIESGMSNLTESTISTSQLSSGVYLIKLIGNSQQELQKLIVK